MTTDPPLRPSAHPDTATHPGAVAAPATPSGLPAPTDSRADQPDGQATRISTARQAALSAVRAETATGAQLTLAIHPTGVDGG